MKHNRMIAGILALILAFGSGGCSSGPDDFNASQKGATEATRQKNEEVYRQLDFNNKDEINAAAKGLLDSPESLEIKDEDGSVIWSQKAFSFVTEDTPRALEQRPDEPVLRTVSGTRPHFSSTRL